MNDKTDNAATEGPIKQPIKGQPLDAEDNLILEKHIESISRQPILMEDLAKQLLTLELAIPGIYISVIKLISGDNSGDKSKFILSSELYYVFSFWLVSVICIIIALLPRPYKIKNSNDLTEIRQSFYQAARYKYLWILASLATFIIGLIFSLKDLST